MKKNKSNFNRVRAALAAYGASGKIFHAPFLDLNPNFELTGAWERSNKQIVNDYPYTKSYDSLDALLSDESVDLVIVNTPTYLHFQHARKVLQAGKHAVVEKAFTVTAPEAEELRQLSDELGLKLFLYQNRRWDTDFRTVQDVYEKGVLGDLIEAIFYFARFNEKLSAKTHKEVDRPGSGIVHDLGPHLIDQALLLFGFPASVFADFAITRKSSKVVDYFDILLDYDPLKVHLKGGYFYREPVPSYALHGRKGSFLKERADPQEDQLKAGMKPNDKGYGVEPEEAEGLLHTSSDQQIIRAKIPTKEGNYMLFYDHLFASLADDLPPAVTSLDGVRIMKIIDAAFRSAKEGRKIELV